jgi:hypothetical protein
MVAGRRVFAFLALLGVIACQTPTLPLPPPVAPEVDRVGDNQYRLRSVHGAEPNAIIVIYNRNPAYNLADRAEAVEVDGEGSWEQVVGATPGDFFDLWQESGSNRSPPTTFQIPK